MPDECKHCIYRPCGKSEQDMKYCLIRFLIINSWRNRKEKKHEKDRR